VAPPKTSPSTDDVAAPEPAPSLEEYQRAAALRAALRVFLRRSEQIARREGLTPQRQLALLMIKGAPDGSERSTVGELAERMQLAQSTVTELVARAERAGLIERDVSDSDGRVAYLRVSAAGERRLAASVTALGPERATLLALLQVLGAALASTVE
jgi:DNA-binding MarR family transcriptional regulator